MTKGEYCKSKGLRIYNPVFDMNAELDDDFKNSVDMLVGNNEETCNKKRTVLRKEEKYEERGQILLSSSI